MINKKLTISKAQAKYKKIYPVHGKRTLEECFISLRGEMFFQFKTKNKKVHTVKAINCQPTALRKSSGSNFILSFIRVVNKPISIRSLFPKQNSHTR